jgi:hypothetical protein
MYMKENPVHRWKSRDVRHRSKLRIKPSVLSTVTPSDTWEGTGTGSGHFLLQKKARAETRSRSKLTTLQMMEYSKRADFSQTPLSAAGRSPGLQLA